ncbi:ribosomal L7Ae/L30e/S12e/Gadd45 family protein [Lactobacillus sp. LL6]|uniref:L7Ae/L30e/S12e/Gadd45 family ribosomal protein n=1 Tax=Lactobacillus sp. LL6 TaxID=2596827 RepID=UPI001185DFE4|nr:ribosomal L7Ae/L30e/S12e/Gadd45 family protein [Lactobacillus sp. LL6]TSO26461.1 50S ribosomal protein L7 [Lactobacillus sp. LL6]
MQEKQKAINFLGLAERARKLVTGTETVIGSIKKGKVVAVILANDVQKNTAEKVIRAAKNKNIPIINIFTYEELSNAIGKKRKVIALTDVGFYKALAKKINEGV